MALRPIQALTYGRFTFAFTMSILITLYPIYTVKTLQVNSSIYALFYAVRGLANTLARLPTGRVSDVVGRRKPLLTSFVLLSATFLLFSMVEDQITIGLVMFLYGISHGIRAVSEWSFLGDVVSSEDLSLANFYFSSVFDLGSALGATIGGSAAMVFSTPSILRAASAILGSSILVISLAKSPKNREDKQS